MLLAFFPRLRTAHAGLVMLTLSLILSGCQPSGPEQGKTAPLPSKKSTSQASAAASPAAPSEAAEQEPASPPTKTTATGLHSRRELLESAAKDPALAEQRDVFIHEARKLLQKPVIYRPNNLEELKAQEGRIPWDRRYATADESIRETFALARSDSMALGAIVNETNALASAYVLTGDRAFLDRALTQIDELTEWDPVQRPGWTSYGTKKLPPPGGDGVWLATGRAIQACVDILDILPPEDVPPELRAKIDALMKREMERILEDWKAQRPWYVRSHAVYSNQWAIPMGGLVNAALYLGKDKYPEAYEYGISALTETLDSQGKKGEFVEGLDYSGATMRCLFSPAYNTALTGDRRLIDHPFLKSYPVWHAMHIQPGGYIVNPFDAGFGARGGLRHFISIYSDMAVMLGSPQALWVLRTQGVPDKKTVNGLLAASLPDSQMAEPPLYDNFPKATMVVWRDSWDEDASGFWMRGGDESDFHDHMDRGHINFIVNGRAILMEAGTPGYGRERFFADYRSIGGHNVLQIGDFDIDTATDAQLTTAGQPRTREHRAAPIEVDWMDEMGGSATADMSAVYPDVEQWTRTADWDATTLEVTDKVVMKKPDIVLFRWHLGSPAKDVSWVHGKLPKESVTLEEGVLTGEGYTVHFSADQPITARVEVRPDNTQGHLSEHYCLIIRSATPVDELTLTTSIDVTE